MTDIHDTFVKMQAEEEERAINLQLGALRQAFFYVVCAGCGEILQDDPYRVGQTGKIYHKTCTPQVFDEPEWTGKALIEEMKRNLERASCGICSNPIGDDPFEIEDDKLVHISCIGKSSDD